MALAPGTRLGPYQIAAPIGAGGMGEVYRARDTRVGRDVAVKILPQDFAADPERRRRFEQEARLAASLNHPNIVGLYDVGPTLDPPYIVSELVSGVSLRVVMGRGAIPLRKALDLAAQMAEGLAAAHAAGVVHRDIKPENVMVTPEGRVKILDFGVARLQVERGAGNGATGAGVAGTQTATAKLETPRETAQGMVVGTVAYMSPEQAAGQAVDFRSDQFSLGLVLFEMLVRRRAFERGSPAQTMAAIIEDEAPPLPAGVPTQVRWVLGRCLAKDPPHRYASTLDLARELRQLGDHASELTPSSGELAVVKRQQSRRRIRALAASAAALALICLAAGRLSVDEPEVDLGSYRLTPLSRQLASSYLPSWSADGKSIAFIGVASGQTKEQVWIQRLDEPMPSKLTRSTFELPEPRFRWLSWTPDSRMIYCPGSIGDEWGIFSIPAAGGDPVLVQAEVLPGALSPDGKTLVMLARESPAKDVRVWYASPPNAPRRLYEPAPIGTKAAVDMPVLRFSPDGAKVLLMIRGESEFSCWILPWPPAKARRMSSLEAVGAMFGAHWTLDSQHLVFAAAPDPAQPPCLFMADARSGRYWPIFVTGNGSFMPAGSPDGTYIAFSSSLSHADVIEMPLDGGPPRTLVGSSAWELAPALSADGKELVYVTDARGPSEVWAKEMRDGSIRRLLTPSEIPADSGGRGVSFQDPVLSRDRRRLAVTTGTSKAVRLFVAFAAGGAPVRATAAGNAVEWAASWSPEGDRLAFLRLGGRYNGLSVVRAGGLDRPVPLLEGLGGILPEWSPTGEWIAAVDTAHIVLVSPDGRSRRELRGKPGPLAWAPDGKTLYVIHDEGGRGWLGAVDLRSGAERRVRDLGDVVPVSASTGPRISVTPDGKSLVYSVARGGTEIWLLEGVKTPRPWYARLWPW
jgi:serine/threonine protein kinase